MDIDLLCRSAYWYQYHLSLSLCLEEQKLFTLYPKKIKNKYINNVPKIVKESYPEIVIPEFPIYSPITWENISFFATSYLVPIL